MLEQQAAKRRYSTSKVGSSDPEEILHLQGKEQWLHFVGAHMKSYSMSKVRETPVRQYVLRESIRGQTD